MWTRSLSNGAVALFIIGCIICGLVASRCVTRRPDNAFRFLTYKDHVFQQCVTRLSILTSLCHAGYVYPEYAPRRWWTADNSIVFR